MSDLISLQPNVDIPLYLVAPDEHRQEVIREVNRPTFARLPKPMPEKCRLITFSRLRAYIEQHKDVIPFLNPGFLRTVSESCQRGHD